MSILVPAGGIRVDLDSRAPANAFQTVNSDGPLIIISGALLQGTKNDDEVAFVLGHEAYRRFDPGHGRSLRAYAGSGGYQPQYQVQRNIENAAYAGASIGAMAYSQTYELEADMLGAYIAEPAGYNSERGSLLFARREGGDVAGENGAMSLWSTHPRGGSVCLNSLRAAVKWIAAFLRRLRDWRRLVEIGLVGRPPAKRRMGPRPVVEAEVASDRGPRLGNAAVGAQVDFLVFHRPPEPFDKDVVAPCSLRPSAIATKSGASTSAKCTIAVRGPLMRRADQSPPGSSRSSARSRCGAAAANAPDGTSRMR
jgi:hypothetical protein